MNSTRSPMILLAAAVALGFPLSALAADESKDTGEKDGAYVEFTKEHPVGEVRTDKALIYVVRPTSAAFGVKSFFLIDDTIAGINKGSSYFFIHVDPGKHVFWSKSENVDALELAVEAGQTYYIQQYVQIGGFKARTKLGVLAAADGEKALAKCEKYGTLTARGLAKGTEIVAEHKKDTQEDLDRRAGKAEEEKKGKAE